MYRPLVRCVDPCPITRLAKRYGSLLLLMVAAGAFQAAGGQTSLYLHHKEGVQVGLEYLRSDRVDKQVIEYSVFSSVWYVSGRFPLGPRMALVGDVPFAYIDLEGGSFIRREALIGNPYLGVEFSRRSSWTYGEIGVRLPVVNTDQPSAAAYGSTADVNRFDAFSVDFIPVLMKAGFRNVSVSNLYTNVQVEPIVLIALNDADEYELFFDYNAMIGYANATVRLAAGLAGQWRVSEPGAPAQSRVFGEIPVHHQAVVHASAGTSRLRTGLLLRVPLDRDLRDVLHFVLGVTFVIDPTIF